MSSPRRPARRQGRLVAVGLLAALLLVPGRSAGEVDAAPLDDPPVGAPAGTRLVDVAGDVGLARRHGAFRSGVSADPAAMMGGGLCWIDADDDGWMDLYVVDTWAESEHGSLVEGGGLPRSTLYRNDHGRFTDVGTAAGASLEVRGQGCLAADLDGDGWTDLYVTTARTSVLLWNDGDGTFTPDGGAAGLDVYGWHTGAAASDLDGDGLLDVVVGGYADVNAPLEGSAGGFPRTHAPVSDLLFRNTGPADGVRARFVEVGGEAGLDPDGPRYTLGVLATDVDADGDPDLLLAEDTQPNRLYRNDSVPGRIVLTDVAPRSGADDDGSGMGVASGDVDGDGSGDLLVTNMGEQRHALLGNRTVGRDIAWSDVRVGLGVPDLGRGLTGWGASLVDLDLDTDLDIVVANGGIPVTDLSGDAQPMIGYEGRDGTLVDASSRWGLDDVAPRVGRGSAVADYDNDGDPDIAVAAVGGRLALLENRGSTGHWLQIDLAGRPPGTRVTADLPSGLRLVREVHAGSSYLSTEDPRVLLGLGRADRVARLEVVGPRGTDVVVRTDVRADQVLHLPPGETPPGADTTTPAAAIHPGPASCTGPGPDAGWSVVRTWIEQALDAIRGDLPHPTVHARNLYHLSAAMWDAWAAYDPGAHAVLTDVSVPPAALAADLEGMRARSIARAAHDVLTSRYADARGGPAVLAGADALLAAGCPVPGVAGQLADRLGAEVARGVLGATGDDGAATATIGPGPVNPPLVVARPGTRMLDPDRWQPLALASMVTQNGITLDDEVQSAIGPRWGWVEGFALPGDPDDPRRDPGPPPRLDDADGGALLRAQVIEVLAASAALDPTDGVVIDASPAAQGDNTLGSDDGDGHLTNPETGRPYEPTPVLRADLARVLAEFWADGPSSETPPGHWNAIAGQVGDAIPPGELRVGGVGRVVDRLEWDVKLSLSLNGALHDAAIAAWGIKAVHDSPRPISLVRHLGGLGQSSDPGGPAHHADGLPLVDGLVEVVSATSAATGGRHERLAAHVGEVAVRAWTPGGVQWVRAVDWVPYQQPTFVSPAFPGYVSGHSTFSRAAAEVLEGMTGSPAFPGGLFTVSIPAGDLAFEDGPTTEVLLQWATYADAADQAGRSRIHGGIHIRADDHAGRRVGALVGQAAWRRAVTIFGPEVPTGGASR